MRFKLIIFASTLLVGASSLADPIGKVLVAGDEWVFSEYAFNGGLFGYPGNPVENGILLDNTLAELSGNSLGTGRLLSLEIANHVNLGAAFDAHAGGHGLAVERYFAPDSTPGPGASAFDLAQYDILAITRPWASTKEDCKAIYDYVMGGGHVLLRAGTGDDSAYWNRFLPTFGMKLHGLGGPVFPADVHVVGGLPQFYSGVSTYTWSNGNPLEVTGPESALAVIGDNPSGLMGYFEDDNTIGTPFYFHDVPEPTSLAALAFPLALLAGKKRRAAVLGASARD